MLVKNYKIWLILGVTLILAYFAPPKDGAAAVSGSNDLGSSGALFSQESGENNKATKSEKIIALQPRELASEESNALNVFSAEYKLPTLTKKPTDAGKKASMPPVKMPAAEPMLPQVPPLPFKALGSYTEDGAQVIFVQHNNQNLVLHVGDTISEKYKLESVDATSLTFIYLPMNLKQTLSLTN